MVKTMSLFVWHMQSLLHTTCALIPGIEQSVSDITLVTTVFADLILSSLVSVVKTCAVGKVTIW